MTAPGTDVVISKAVLDEFARMAGALEEFDTTGMDGILSDILAATDVDSYNKVLNGDRAMPIGRSIKVERVRYAQSEFTAGLPFYLVVDGVDTSSGEVGQWVTGATTVVAALVRATFAGHLPVIGRQVESAKPTKSGYTPINWIMEAIGGNGQAPLSEPKGKK